MTDQTMIEKVARAIYEEDDPWHTVWPWPDLQEDQTEPEKYRQVAIAAINAMHGWQPIETAPRDGTHFLATAIVRNIKTDARWWETHVIWADDETGEVHPECDHGWSRIEDYSHWMPLPPPPAIDAALKGEG